jgi:hypothetical protein
MPYTIQGNSAPISEEPRIVQGRHYVPLTEIVQQLGGQTTWDNDNKVATATIGQWTATIRMADRNIDVSGTPVALQSDPFVENDLMYVPATFFKDAFGYNVEVDPGTHAVSIALP